MLQLYRASFSAISMLPPSFAKNILPVYTYVHGIRTLPGCFEVKIKKHHRACHTYSTVPSNIFFIPCRLFLFAFPLPCNPTYYSAVERVF